VWQPDFRGDASRVDLKGDSEMATENVCTVEVRSVYGNETVYPADEAATLFCQIAGTRTLTRDMITSIRALGYAVVLAPQITKVLA
jgi:hypothetical protein